MVMGWFLDPLPYSNGLFFGSITMWYRLGFWVHYHAPRCIATNNIKHGCNLLYDFDAVQLSKTVVTTLSRPMLVADISTEAAMSAASFSAAISVAASFSVVPF